MHCDLHVAYQLVQAKHVCKIQNAPLSNLYIRLLT